MSAYWLYESCLETGLIWPQLSSQVLELDVRSEIGGRDRLLVHMEHITQQEMTASE
jgi:hypothetical protein